MDVIELSFVVGSFVIAAGVGIQHFYDRFSPKGLYLRSAGLASQLPARIGSEVESALNRVSVQQRAILEADAKAAEAAYAGQIKTAEMAIVRGVGVDKQLKGRVDALLGEAILGPAMPILRQFAPGLADALEENPQLIDVVVQNPLFRKYVAPRIEQYLGSVGAAQETPGGSWGT